MVPGVALLAYGGYTLLGADSHKGRLSSSMHSDDSLKNAMSGISMVIWGLIAAKAKQGVDATNAKDTESVGQALQRAATLILMVTVAAGFNIYSHVEASEAVVKNASPKLLELAPQKLQSASPLDTHYNGGVANNAFL
jgi:hypothetical protein